MVGKGGYSEDAMVSTYLEVHDDGISTKKAAQRYGIPRTTLRDRLHGISVTEGGREGLLQRIEH